MTDGSFIIRLRSNRGSGRRHPADGLRAVFLFGLAQLERVAYPHQHFCGLHPERCRLSTSHMKIPQTSAQNASSSSGAAENTRGPQAVPHTSLNADAVRDAYRRWAKVYDSVFGGVSAYGRRRAVEAVNRLPGHQVLEVGVGTGLALPRYCRDKRITGIDLSTDMLALGRERVREQQLANVETLLEMDAEAMSFADNSFDIAVAMFVASVVPHPVQLMAEMRRVVRPGGWLLFVNHFAAEKGPRWWIERAMAPASHALGWHPDFAFEALLSPQDRARAEITPVQPFGIFTLVQLQND
ncbi:Phosphatidyl-N-methylethanolamine N-methyltransferase [Granulibacter bethesdensis CGDNIH4]|nr:Phosphatidyl-N-methylethanolamine N-methyltransferase [Granulibacter bethesdensis CGDNIH4]